MIVGAHPDDHVYHTHARTHTRTHTHAHTHACTLPLRAHKMQKLEDML